MNIISKVTAGAAVALTLGLAPALADGVDKKASYAAPAPVAAGCDASKFAGFYAGVHIGAGSLTSTTTDRDFATWGGSDQVTEDGIAVGGQVGYNWVKCSGLFGIEADLSWTNIDSNRSYFNNAPNPANVSNSLDWLGSIRTRSGIAIGDVMLYATGGLAFASIDNAVTQANFIGANALDVRSSGTRWGWVAGVGSEYALTDTVRLTGDVLYYDFGTESSSQTFTPPGSTFRFDDHHTLWVSRIGLNFKLGDRTSYEPLK